MKTFAAYIPAETQRLSLRQAVRRKNGHYVWGIIREDAWDIALDKENEEVGVFLPDISPDKLPYEPQDISNTFRSQYQHQGQHENQLRTPVQHPNAAWPDSDSGSDLDAQWRAVALFDCACVVP